MKFYLVEGITLKGSDFGDGHRMLTVVTKDLGKIKVVAYGAKKVKSKKRGALLEFTRTNIYLRKNKEYFVAEQAEGLEYFPNLYGTKALLDAAAEIAWLTDRFWPWEQENFKLYNWILYSFRFLNNGVWSKLILRNFELKLLAFTGFKPVTTHCAICRKPYRGEWWYFGAGEGGVVCPDCRLETGFYFEVTPEILKNINTLLLAGPEKLANLSIEERVLERIKAILEYFLGFQLGEKIKLL
ncbi:DNA repair protein RecO [Carboxydothermus pertinax]|uniref:DNA repair protein RecO n=1 Tax=Carboxydothermus pertinax TaxID=870242 RepID=A0A1L8CW72_9THEO|nr:DNA repair protein RecO [Carboxydothermus pertinax]GAV23166.1 DNA repair protein RecO [Carboxydothermus pertinax]